MKQPIQCVLFDLDGTLLDTAPDLLAALNAVLSSEGRKPYTLAQARHTVSHGSIGMLELAFGVGQAAPELERRRRIFLDHYAANISRETTFFATVPDLLGRLEQAEIPWGIVTNKPEYLTFPLLRDMALTERAQCIVGGDTLAVAKPHPEPSLLAAQQCGVAPEACLYVGDAERDIQAGRSARMQTLAAAYGYVQDDEHLAWQADGIIDDPLAVWDWLATNAES